LIALSGAKGSPAGVRVRAVGDPFLALAELCRITRDERRVAQGPTSARLVIVYPEMLTDAPELCAAADTYAPDVPRWQYGPVANPTLRPIVEADVARWQGKVEVVVTESAKAMGAGGAGSRTVETPRQAPIQGPKLRLAGEGPEVDNQANPVDAQGSALFADVAPPPAQTAPAPERSAPLISDEELRMLLGENTDENR